MNFLYEAHASAGDGVPVNLIATGANDVVPLYFDSVQTRPLPMNTQESGPRLDDRAGAELETAAAEESMLALRAEIAAEVRDGLTRRFEHEISLERRRVRALLREAIRERSGYFASAETEVVRLAIAIARHVLAREIAHDRLHLRDIARAALARVQDGSKTTLRVCAQDAEAWRLLFTGMSKTLVDVVEDETLGEGECTLETSVGRVEVGVEVQMQEIERAFGQLMSRKGSRWRTLLA